MAGDSDISLLENCSCPHSCRRPLRAEDNEALTFTIRELAASKFVKYLALRTAIGENSEQILKATEPTVVQDLATENEGLVVEWEFLEREKR